MIRHASIANKWKTVHLLLHGGMNATTLYLNLTLQRDDDQEFRLQLTLEVDTREGPKPSASTPRPSKHVASPATPLPEAEVLFEDIPEEKRFPKVRRHGGNTTRRLPEELGVPRVNLSLLPREARARLEALDSQLEQGDITLKGYSVSRAALLRAFLVSFPDAAVRPAVPTAQMKDDVEAPEEKPRRGSPAGVGGRQGSPRPVFPAEPGKADGLDPGANPSLVSDTKAGLKSGTHAPATGRIVFREKVPPPVWPENHGTKKTTTEQEEEKQVEAKAGDPVDTRDALPGRKLQLYAGSYLGFLPWEKRKYFQDLLDVS